MNDGVFNELLKRLQLDQSTGAQLDLSYIHDKFTYKSLKKIITSSATMALLPIHGAHQ